MVVAYLFTANVRVSFAALFKFGRGDMRQLTADVRVSVCCPFQV